MKLAPLFHVQTRIFHLGTIILKREKIEKRAGDGHSLIMPTISLKAQIRLSSGHLENKRQRKGP